MKAALSCQQSKAQALFTCFEMGKRAELLMIIRFIFAIATWILLNIAAHGQACSIGKTVENEPENGTLYVVKSANPPTNFCLQQVFDRGRSNSDKIAIVQISQRFKMAENDPLVHLEFVHTAEELSNNNALKTTKCERLVPKNEDTPKDFFTTTFTCIVPVRGGGRHKFSAKVDGITQKDLSDELVMRILWRSRKVITVPLQP